MLSAPTLAAREAARGRFRALAARDGVLAALQGEPGLHALAEARVGELAAEAGAAAAAAERDELERASQERARRDLRELEAARERLDASFPGSERQPAGDGLEGRSREAEAAGRALDETTRELTSALVAQHASAAAAAERGAAAAASSAALAAAEASQQGLTQQLAEQAERLGALEQERAALERAADEASRAAADTAACERTESEALARELELALQGREEQAASSARALGKQRAALKEARREAAGLNAALRRSEAERVAAGRKLAIVSSQLELLLQDEAAARAEIERTVNGLRDAVRERRKEVEATTEHATKERAEANARIKSLEEELSTTRRELGAKLADAGEGARKERLESERLASELRATRAHCDETVGTVRAHCEEQLAAARVRSDEAATVALEARAALERRCADVESARATAAAEADVAARDQHEALRLRDAERARAEALHAELLGERRARAEETLARPDPRELLEPAEVEVRVRAAVAESELRLKVAHMAEMKAVHAEQDALVSEKVREAVDVVKADANARLTAAERLLNETNEQADAKLEEAHSRAHRQAHKLREQLAAMTLSAEEESARLREEHAAAMDACRSSAEKETARLRAKHEATVAAVEQRAEEEVERLRAHAEKEAARVAALSEQEVSRLRAQSQQDLSRLRAQAAIETVETQEAQAQARDAQAQVRDAQAQARDLSAEVARLTKAIEDATQGVETHASRAEQERTEAARAREALEKARDAHSAELAALRALASDELSAARAVAAREAEAQREEKAADLARVREEARAELIQARAARDEDLARLREAHAAEISHTHAEHANEAERLRTELGERQRTTDEAREALEGLRREGEEARRVAVEERRELAEAHEAERARLLGGAREAEADAQSQIAALRQQLESDGRTNSLLSTQLKEQAAKAREAIDAAKELRARNDVLEARAQRSTQMLVKLKAGCVIQLREFKAQLGELESTVALQVTRVVADFARLMDGFQWKYKALIDKQKQRTNSEATSAARATIAELRANHERELGERHTEYEVSFAKAAEALNAKEAAIGESTSELNALRLRLAELEATQEARGPLDGNIDELKRELGVAQLQVGDLTRLLEQKNECVALLGTVVASHFDVPDEYAQSLKFPTDRTAFMMAVQHIGKRISESADMAAKGKSVERLKTRVAELSEANAALSARAQALEERAETASGELDGAVAAAREEVIATMEAVLAESREESRGALLSLRAELETLDGSVTAAVAAGAAAGGAASAGGANEAAV